MLMNGAEYLESLRDGRTIRIGSAVDGTVTGFIPDPAERGGTSGAEGVAVDTDGNVYGAEVGPRDLKKYIPRSRGP